MDDKRTNIRLVRSGGRRVTGGSGQSRSASVPREPSGGEMSGSEALRKKVRYQKKQKELRLKRKRRTLALTFIFVIVLVLVLLFLTPIFNIRSISVEGNNVVTEQQITECLKPFIGQNVLRTGESRIQTLLREIPYINTVDVQKKMFPPSVSVRVTEYTPAAVVRAEGRTLLISSSLHVLEETESAAFNLPVVTGIEVKSAEIGKNMSLGSEEKEETLRIILDTLESTGIIGKVKEVAIGDMTSITLNYDDRITAMCGTQLDIERKLRLFREAVVSDALADNARGTIDLSVTGKAVYTP